MEYLLFGSVGAQSGSDLQLGVVERALGSQANQRLHEPVNWLAVRRPSYELSAVLSYQRNGNDTTCC